MDDRRDGRKGIGRSVALLVAGMVVGGLMVSPAGAHVTSSVTHLINKHLKPLFYTKNQSDLRFLGISDQAVDADRLDGMDSTEFLGANAKAADSDKLDGMDSTAFLGVGAKAADADKLDGFNSPEFWRGGFAIIPGTASATTTSTTFTDLPGASYTFTVPAGSTAHVLAFFSAESLCTGGAASDWCSVRILLDGTEMLPDSGLDFAFDASDGTASSDLWEGNSMTRGILAVAAGTHTVKVQWAVVGTPTFRLDDWLLTVLLDLP